MKKVTLLNQDTLEPMAVLEGLDFAQRSFVFQHGVKQCLEHVRELPKRMQPTMFNVFSDFYESNCAVTTSLFRNFVGEEVGEGVAEAMEQMVSGLSFEDKAKAFHLTGQANLQEILAYKGENPSLLKVESQVCVFFEHYTGGIDSLYNLMVDAENMASGKEDV